MNPVISLISQSSSRMNPAIKAFSFILLFCFSTIMVGQLRAEVPSSYSSIERNPKLDIHETELHCMHNFYGRGEYISLLKKRIAAKPTVDDYRRLVFVELTNRSFPAAEKAVAQARKAGLNHPDFGAVDFIEVFRKTPKKAPAVFEKLTMPDDEKYSFIYITYVMFRKHAHKLPILNNILCDAVEKTIAKGKPEGFAYWAIGKCTQVMYGMRFICYSKNDWVRYSPYYAVASGKLWESYSKHQADIDRLKKSCDRIQDTIRKVPGLSMYALRVDLTNGRLSEDEADRKEVLKRLKEACLLDIDCPRRECFSPIRSHEIYNAAQLPKLLSKYEIAFSAKEVERLRNRKTSLIRELILRKYWEPA